MQTIRYMKEFPWMVRIVDETDRRVIAHFPNRKPSNAVNGKMVFRVRTPSFRLRVNRSFVESVTTGLLARGRSDRGTALHHEPLIAAFPTTLSCSSN